MKKNNNNKKRTSPANASRISITAAEAARLLKLDDLSHSARSKEQHPGLSGSQEDDVVFVFFSPPTGFGKRRLQHRAGTQQGKDAVMLMMQAAPKMKPSSREFRLS